MSLPMKYRKKGKLTLNTFYPIAQYMAVVMVALSYPRLSPVTWLLPGITGPRAVMLLWVAALLGVDALMDRAYLRAYRKDLWELENKVPHGGMNRSTLLAIDVPCLFLLDIAAIAHLYLSYFRGGAGACEGMALSMHTGAMAVGCVLMIYGRLLPRLPFGSIWGLRTKATLKDQTAWGKAHLKAEPWFCACGGAALAAGMLLQPAPALAVAAGCCALALAAFVRCAGRLAE